MRIASFQQEGGVCYAQWVLIPLEFCVPYTYSQSRIAMARFLEQVFSWLGQLTSTLRPGYPIEQNIRSILIVEPFQLGDVVSLSVMFDPLRQSFPDAHIDIFTQPKSKEIFSYDPRVAAVYTCAVPWAKYRKKRGTFDEWRQFIKALRTLRKQNYDVGIDPRGDVRSQIVMLLAGCRRRIGPLNYLGSNMIIRGSLLTDSVGVLPAMHRYEINRAVLRPLVGPQTFPMTFPSFQSDTIPAKFVSRAGKQILVHVGGGWIYKRWKTERWVELINRVGHLNGRHIVLVGSSDEEEVVGEIAKKLDVPHVVCITTLRELIGLMKGADMFIGLDSGPMNLAVTLGIPSVVLFGPGDSELWFPLGPRDVFFHVRDGYPCNPCFQRTCIFSERSCMTGIEVGEVAQAIERLCGTASQQ